MRRTIVLRINFGLVLVVALSCVSACGQKGDLYLPPEQADYSFLRFSTIA